MDFLKSGKGYGKMDPAEDREFRRKSRTRVIVIALTGLLLLAIIAGVAITVSINNRRSVYYSSSPHPPVSTSSSIRAVCSVTRYPDSCFDSLSAATANSSVVAADPVTLFQISLSVTSRSISKLSSFLPNLEIPVADRRLQAAVRDCKELLDDALDRVNESSAILADEEIISDSKISNLKTWLSATITDQDTCLDGFEGTAGGFREKLQAAMTNSTRFASNSLAIATGLLGIKEKFHFPINRKLLSTLGQRRVSLAGKTAANVMAVKEGSWMMKSIQAADKVPRSQHRRSVDSR